MKVLKVSNPELAYNCFFAEQVKKERFELKVKKTKSCVELIIDAKDNVMLKAISTSMSKLNEVYRELENGY